MDQLQTDLAAAQDAQTACDTAWAAVATDIAGLTGNTVDPNDALVQDVVQILVEAGLVTAVS